MRKEYFKYICFLLLCMFFSFQEKAKAQCSTPPAFTLEIDGFDCGIGNEKAEVKIELTAGNPADYQYIIDGQTYVSNFSSNASLWDASTLTIKELLEGEHEIEVAETSDSTCSSKKTIGLSKPSPIMFMTEAVDISCSGLTEGKISIKNVTHYRGEYDSLIFQIVESSEQVGNSVFSDLSSGTYSVFVTDKFGCESEKQSVTVNAEIGIDAQSSNIPYCIPANSGSIQMSVPSVLDPSRTVFEYSVDGGVNYQNASLFNGLGIGQYSVRIRGESGCLSETESVIISKTEKINFTVSISQPDCFGENGLVSFGSASNGSGSYTYYIDNSVVSPLSNPILQGSTVLLEVEDSDGCKSAQQSVTISTIPEIKIDSYLTIDNSCNGDSQGRIYNIATSGGNGNYNYYIDGVKNGAIGQNYFTSLPAKMYEIRVEDAKGCLSDIVSVSITEPSPVFVNINQGQGNYENCYKENTGKIYVTDVSGGPVGATYSLSFDGGLDEMNFPIEKDNLSGGNYSIRAKASIGATLCYSDIENVFISEKDSLTFVVNSVSPSCINFSDAEITINALNTGGGKTYYVDGKAYSSNVVTGLKSGDRTVYLITPDGCQSQPQTVNIPKKDDFIINILHGTSSCHNVSDGRIVINILQSDGSKDLKYTINNGSSFSNDPIFRGLQPYSTITAYAIDTIKNCKSNSITVINTPKMKSIILPNTVVKTLPTCYASSDGAITLPSPGYEDNTIVPGPFEYYLSTQSAQTNSQFNNLEGGVYTGQVKHSESGCFSNEVSIFLTAPEELESELEDVKDKICFSEQATGQVKLKAIGGTPSYSYDISKVSQNTTLNYAMGSIISGIDSGKYYFYIRDSNGCTDSVYHEIEKLEEISVQTTSKDLTCFNSDDGIINLSVSGGIGYEYKYSLNSDSDFNEANKNLFITGLKSGDYDIYIEDGNGCVTPTPTGVTIADKDEILISVNTTPISCAGDENGVIQININQKGATDILEYTVDNGLTYQKENLFSGLRSKNYSVFAKNQDGCLSNISAQPVTSPNKIKYDYTTFSVECENDQNAIEFLSVENCLGCTFSLDSGLSFSNSLIFRNLKNESFYLLLKDEKNCFSESSLVDFGMGFSIDPEITPINCEGDKNASINLNLVGGTPPYRITWNDTDKQATSTAIGLSPGIYGVEIVDYNGCIIEQDFNITETPQSTLSANFTVDKTSVEITDTKVSVSSFSNNAISYIWQVADKVYFDEEALMIELPKEPNEYDIILKVEDTHGCLDTTSKKVKVNPLLKEIEMLAFTPNGDNLNDAFTPIRKTSSSEDIICKLVIVGSSDDLKIEKNECEWDGKYKGEYVNAGYYHYVIEYTIGEYTNVYRGGVSLVR